MRVADYSCHVCGHRWVLRLTADTPLVMPCPKCGQIAATLNRAKAQPSARVQTKPKVPKQLKAKGEAA